MDLFLSYNVFRWKQKRVSDLSNFALTIFVQFDDRLISSKSKYVNFIGDEDVWIL